MQVLMLINLRIHQRQLKLVRYIDNCKHIDGPLQKVLYAEVLPELIQQLKQLK